MILIVLILDILKDLIIYKIQIIIVINQYNFKLTVMLTFFELLTINLNTFGLLAIVAI